MATELPEQPLSRKEQYLADIAGQDVTLPAEPRSREEQYLAYIAENGTGGGGGGGTTYTAGDGITIANDEISVDLAQATGSSTTKVMSQKAVTDALASAGGSTTVLTTADYNWNSTAKDSVTTPFDCFAVWLLPSGMYKMGDEYIIETPSSSYKYNTSPYNNSSFIVFRDEESSGGQAGYTATLIFHSTSQATSLGEMIYSDTGMLQTGNFSNGALLKSSDIINNLTSTEWKRCLSAAQGKVLKDLIDSLVIKNAGAPTTSTVGTVGQLLEDTTNGKLYQCTAVSGNTYTWSEVGAGGGASGFTNGGTTYASLNTQGSVGDAWSYVEGYSSTTGVGTTPRLQTCLGYVSNRIGANATTDTGTEMVDFPVTNPGALLTFLQQETGTTVDPSQGVVAFIENMSEGSCDVWFPDDAVSSVTVSRADLAANGLDITDSVWNSGYIQLEFYEDTGYEWQDTINYYSGGIKIRRVTQEGYDAIPYPDPGTLYIIVSSGE